MEFSASFELPDASALWDTAPALVFIVAIITFVRVVTAKLGADTYEWAKRAVRRDPDAEKKEIVSAGGDWDTRKIVSMWLQWPLAMAFVVVLARLPGLFMPPVMWHFMEALIYGYILWRNLEHWTSIDLFERLHPNGRTLIWGENSNRRRATKRRMMRVNMVFFVVLLFLTVGEMRADRTVAEKYCLSDLPAKYHKLIHSYVRRVPLDHITDEQMRDLLRSERANALVKEGLCKR